MPDSSRMIRRIVGSTAGIWLISLLAFCSYCQKKDCVSAWEAGAFGIWMIAVFAISYVLISRIVNKTMERVDDCIQSLIDGQPDQQFSTEEESLLGKFQMQILKLVPYHGPLKGNAGAKKGRTCGDGGGSGASGQYAAYQYPVVLQFFLRRMI